MKIAGTTKSRRALIALINVQYPDKSKLSRDTGIPYVTIYRALTNTTSHHDAFVVVAEHFGWHENPMNPGFFKFKEAA